METRYLLTVELSLVECSRFFDALPYFDPHLRVRDSYRYARAVCGAAGQTRARHFQLLREMSKDNEHRASLERSMSEARRLVDCLIGKSSRLGRSVHFGSRASFGMPNQLARSA